MGGNAAYADVGELIAAREVVTFVVEVGFRDIMLECHNLGVINAI